MTLFKTHECTFVDFANNEVSISLYRYFDSELEVPPTTPQYLPVLDGSEKISFEFSDDQGYGVLTRTYECYLQSTSSNNIADQIIENPDLYRLVIYIDGHGELFNGTLVENLLETDFDVFDKNSSPEYSQIKDSDRYLVFTDSITNHADSNISRLRTMIAASSNQYHTLSGTPIADLILSYIYEGITGLVKPLLFVHTWQLRYFDPISVPVNIWLHRLRVNLSNYNEDLTIRELLRSICYTYNLCIGYSFKRDAITVVDYNTLDIGYEPFIDDSNEIQALYPTLMYPTANNVMATEPADPLFLQKIELSNLNTKAIGNRNKRSKVRRRSHIIVKVTAFQAGPGEYEAEYRRYSNDTDIVSPLEIDTKYKSYGHTVIASDGTIKSYSTLESPYFSNRTIVNPSFQVLPVKDIVGMSRLLVNYYDRDTYKLEVDSYHDPMLPSEIVSPHLSNDKTLRFVKGEWNIVSAKTYIEAKQMGTAAEAPGNRFIGVPFSQWKFNNW